MLPIDGSKTHEVSAIRLVPIVGSFGTCRRQTT